MPLIILQPTHLVSTSRQIINDNFSYLSSLSSLSGLISGSQTLDFPSIPSGESADLVITATGVTPGSPVLVGPPSTLEASLSPSWFAGPSANQITVRLTNNDATGAPVNPASALWTWSSPGATLAALTSSSVLSGSIPLNFPSIPRGESKVLSFPAAGVVAGSVVQAGPPASWDDEVSFVARASAADTIKIIVTNNHADGLEYDPPLGTWTWMAVVP